MNCTKRVTPWLMVAALMAGCGRGSPPAESAGTATDRSATSVASAPAAASATGPAPRSVNLLRMRVDGVEWQADHDLFGAVHPPGMDRAVLIAGGRGPKDASEQTFNINLFGVDAPGTFQVKGSDIRGSVAQIGNLSPERFLVGAGFGFDLHVELITMQTLPTRIEARFAGTLIANDSSTVTIEDGEFRYFE